MKRLRLLALASVLFGLSASVPADDWVFSEWNDELRSYAIDLSQSQITVTLKQEGLMGRLRPQHVVAVKKFSGRINLPPRDETRVVVEVEAETRSLENVDQEMSEIERREFHNVLRNVVLAADKHPGIRFSSVSVTNVRSEKGDRAFTLNGDLTLKGVTRRVSLPVNVKLVKGELRATGEGKLKQTEFGITPYTGGFGTIKIGDEVKVSFVVVAKPI